MNDFTWTEMMMLVGAGFVVLVIATLRTIAWYEAQKRPWERRSRRVGLVAK